MKYTVEKISIVILTISLIGCKKEFLDKKPTTDIVAPSTIEDFKNLLDNDEVINYACVALSNLASDEYYYLDYNAWENAFSLTEKNSYIWAEDIYGGEIKRNDWNLPYRAIFYANTVLNGINEFTINSDNQNQINNLKGWAYFIRAYYFYDLVRNFAPLYDKSFSKDQLGIPLKLNSDIDEVVMRSTLEDSYNQIFSDLFQARLLLDQNLPYYNRNRPSRIAVYALNARIYLSMNEYEKACLYADSTLLLYNELIDYNECDTLSYTPFSQFNTETIFSTINHIAYGATSHSEPGISIDSNLIELYESNDLRLLLYYEKNSLGNYNRKRGYDGVGGFPFTGLAIDEIYLIKSECQVRSGKIDEGILTLNLLLSKRYKSGTFSPLFFMDKQDALDRVLMERRKELVFRALRWSDLKRLNKEGANITLTRMLDDKVFKILPNSLKYIFPIPDDEISLSGIQQNQRN